MINIINILTLFVLVVLIALIRVTSPMKRWRGVLIKSRKLRLQGAEKSRATVKSLCQSVYNQDLNLQDIGIPNLEEKVLGDYYGLGELIQRCSLTPLSTEEISQSLQLDQSRVRLYHRFALLELLRWNFLKGP